MRELRGVAASPGMAMAPAFILYDDVAPQVPSHGIGAEDIPAEWDRFTRAVEKTRIEVTELRDSASVHAGKEQAAIFETHLLMLDDPELIDRVREGLESSRRNVEHVVLDLERDLVAKLSSIQDPYVQERISDVHDVSRRIMGHLMGRQRFCLADIAFDTIVVADDLLPSDMISMNRERIKAVVTHSGGRTSHAAILARAFEIPAVLGVGSETLTIRNGTMLIVDGSKGIVYADPDEAAMSRALAAMDAYSHRTVEFAASRDLPSVTLDGTTIRLMANIEISDEIGSVVAHGADGIGLFRSEFLFLGGHVPGEEEQFNAYRTVLEGMGGKPVTIRTLDIGGDKVLPEFGAQDEKNPLLGWRAIRFCLSNPEIFKTQLRALLRASVFGDLRIMFPMISTSDELDRARGLLEVARSECRSRGYAVAPSLPVGIMIEIPSAAIASDILARNADFFSIGTNDLIQYTMAVDRGNERVAALHEPFHPAVLRLVKMTIDNAHAAGIRVGMCGEMAADPAAAVLLAGMGIDELSMSSVAIPSVKRVIRAIDIATAGRISGTVMGMRSSGEVAAYLAARVRA